jgi:hypothetical protein
MDKDTILAVLQSEIALAGLLLVFAGFLITKSAGLAAAYKGWLTFLTVVTLLAFLANLGLCFLCVNLLKGSRWGEAYLLSDLEISLGITAFIGVVGLLASA